MGTTPDKILFVHNGATSFVRTDLALLRERYPVTELFFRERRIDPIRILRLVSSHDLLFGWFASWHTFLPLLFARLLHKPALLVVGGYDLANMPEIGYGHQRGGIKKHVSRWTMQLTTVLITNSHYSREEAYRNAGIPKERVQVIYHGVADCFGTGSTMPRSPAALTVGNVEASNLWRKGHEPFVRAAAALPQVEFTLAGAWRDGAIAHLRKIAPPNVTFTGWLDDAALLDCYRRSAVYVQASAHEGFGLSLAEAMLAGCVPVVTRTGALPEVVGAAGIYLASNEPQAIAEGIQTALQADEQLGRQARERVLQAFPLQKRKEALHRLVDQALSLPSAVPSAQA